MENSQIGVNQTQSEQQSIKNYNAIVKFYKWAKGNAVVGGVILAMILSISGFAWKNADPPLVKAQIEQIHTEFSEHIKNEDQTKQKNNVDIELLKANAANTNSKVNDISDEQIRQGQRLDQIYNILASKK